MRRAVVALLLLTGLVLPGPLPLVAKDKPARPKAESSQQGAGQQGADQDQGGGLNFADQKSGTPLEIYADQGLELSQDAKTVIGRVNAKAIRGRVTVTGDVMVAHYRDKKPAPGTPGADQTTKPAKPAKTAPASDKAGDKSGDKGADKTGEQSGSSEIWRVEADGHVTIATETETAYGDHADYNIDDAVVVLTGKNLRLITPTDVITARDSLEYWEHRQQAVARGSAVAVREEKRIQADVLVADFAENAQKQMAMQRAHGYDHVILTTAREVVTGDRADYNAETGIVTVTGSVKMTRDNNQLDGGYAVVNLDTGISRLYPAAPGVAETTGGDQRVKGLFVQQKKQGAGAAAAPASSAPAESPGAASGPAATPAPAAEPSAPTAEPSASEPAKGR